MLGYCETGNAYIATAPISTIRIASTLASTGRLMKKTEIMTGHRPGAAGGALRGDPPSPPGAADPEAADEPACATGVAAVPADCEPDPAFSPARCDAATPAFVARG